MYFCVNIGGGGGVLPLPIINDDVMMMMMINFCHISQNVQHAILLAIRSLPVFGSLSCKDWQLLWCNTLPQTLPGLTLR